MIEVEVEEKFKDITFSCATLFPVATNAGVISLLNAVAQGSGENQRQGKRIYMRDTVLSGVIMKSATQTGESAIRLVLVYDRQTNGALPAAVDILAVDNIAGLYNRYNADRFEILYDETFPFGSVESTTICLNELIANGFPCNYFSTTFNNVQDIMEGSLVLLTYSTSNLTTAGPAGNLYTRVYFDDV